MPAPVELVKLPDGRVFPVFAGETLSWDPGLYMTIAEELIGWPRARAVLAAIATHRPDQLQKLRRNMLRARFDRVFGRNAERLLTLIDLVSPTTTSGPAAQTVADLLAGKRSATIGKLHDTEHPKLKTTIRLVSWPNDPSRWDFQLIRKGAGGESKTQKMGFRIEREESIAKVLAHLQDYLDTDDPGRWKVVSAMAPSGAAASRTPREGRTKRSGVRQARREAGEHPEVAQLRAELARLKGLRYKTGPQEKLILSYEKRLAADPWKWNPGDGVGWRVTPTQINRGFRIIEVLHDNKKAVIRQVADTGLTRSGGRDPLMGEQVVWLGDLVRDRRYDLPKGEREFEQQQIQRVRQMEAELAAAEEADAISRAAAAAAAAIEQREQHAEAAAAQTTFEYLIEYLGPPKGTPVAPSTDPRGLAWSPFGAGMALAQDPLREIETAEGEITAHNARDAINTVAEIAEDRLVRITVCPVGGSEYDCRMVMVRPTWWGQTSGPRTTGVPADVEQRIRELERHVMELQSRLGHARTRREWDDTTRQLDYARARLDEMRRHAFRPGSREPAGTEPQPAQPMEQGVATREFESRLAWLQNWVDRTRRGLAADELYRELLVEFPAMTRYHYDIAMRSLGRDPESGMTPRIRDVGRHLMTTINGPRRRAAQPQPDPGERTAPAIRVEETPGGRVAADIARTLFAVFTKRRANPVPPRNRPNAWPMPKDWWTTPGFAEHQVEVGHSIPGGDRPGIALRVADTPEGPLVQISEINAPPSHKGMGSEMVDAIVKTIRGHGVRRLRVHHDWSEGWWPKIQQRYPDIEWNVSGNVSGYPNRLPLEVGGGTFRTPARI